MQRFSNVEFGPNFSVEVYSGSGSDVTKAYVDGQDALRLLDASIGAGLVWNNGLLDVSIAASGGLDPDIDYDTYAPKDASVTFTYNSEGLVTNVTSIGSKGVKTVDFTYSGTDVIQVDVSKYGVASRTITFESVDGIICEINILNK